MALNIELVVGDGEFTSRLDRTKHRIADLDARIRDNAGDVDQVERHRLATSRFRELAAAIGPELAGASGWADDQFATKQITPNGLFTSALAYRPTSLYDMTHATNLPERARQDSRRDRTRDPARRAERGHRRRRPRRVGHEQGWLLPPLRHQDGAAGRPARAAVA